MAHFLDKDGLQRFFNGLKNVFALKDHSHTTVNGHTVNADVPSGAKFTDTVYTHPSYTSKSSGLYKVTVDSTGHVSGTTAVAKSDITALGIPAQDTTYSSKAAASGGTDVSLVTTGEKYTWNSKTSNTGTVTSVATGVGLTGGSITTSGTIKAKLRSETALTRDSAAATETANRVYPVVPDKSGYLAVNVPWTDTNTQTITGVKGNSESSYRTGNVNLTAANIGAAAASHTHSYAGSQSAGGAADKALSIPIAIMDTSSTATVFKAQVDGLTELSPGVFFALRNDVVTSAADCTLNINGLGAKPIYTWQTSGEVSTAFIKGTFGLFWYDTDLVSGGCWVMSYNTNTTYTAMHQLYHSTAGGYLADSVVYRYQLLFQMDEDTVTPLNNVSNSTGTSKAMLTNVEFDPFGEILYYGGKTTVNADARVDGGSTFFTANINLRYTFNCGTTLTAYEPFYLKVVMQSNGKVKLATGTCWAQSLPTTNDGYYYIYLGRTYSTYQGHLYPWHPVYYHDGTQIREYVNPEKAISANQVASGTLSRDRLPGGMYIDMGTISSLPVTKTFTGVRTDMVVARMELGTPSAQRSDWTVNTDTANSITISGTISGSTTCKILLVQAESGTAS